MHALQHISPWTAAPVHRCLEYLNGFLWIWDERETSRHLMWTACTRPCCQGGTCQHETTGGGVMTISSVLLCPYHLQRSIILAFGLRDQGKKEKTSQYNRYSARDLNPGPSEYEADVSSTICYTGVSSRSRGLRNTRHLLCRSPQSVQKPWFKTAVLEELIKPTFLLRTFLFLQICYYKSNYIKLTG
jgi:hypothetical protein